jgi:SAM-dependent methyltransferase/acyl carrier protein
MLCNSYGSDEATIRSLITKYTQVHLAGNSYNVVLEDMGLDSLQATELSTALKRQFDIKILPDILLISTISHVLQLLARPLDALAQADASFRTFAKKRGYTNYWIDVAPLFDELLLSYILEAFTALSINLAAINEGNVITDIAHLPKYDRLLERLKIFLASRNLILQLDDKFIRSRTSIEVRPSAQLNAALRELFPQYSPETELLNLVGPRLAECVSGETNPITIMFGNLPALRIMEHFYANSPMMSTLTDQLVEFLSIFIRSKNGSHVQKPLRILEIGAGTGGTTTRLVEMLQSIGCLTQYTFTDISAAFVSQAKRKYKQYPWIDFSVLNLEEELENQWKGQYDVVIGANVVHATSDRAATCRRLRTTLREGGFLVLSEITRAINWYDICFGLLDGWWLAEEGKGYPIQSAEAWMSTFRSAGFTRVGFSWGESLEANSQQLLVGCN